MCIEHTLGVRHSFNHFKHINMFSPQNTSMMYILLLPHFPDVESEAQRGSLT